MKTKNAFSLIELVITLVILAILGIISFISMQGYNSTSRDSVRISDLSTMKTSLELFYLNAGKYPEPTNGFNIYHSGSIIWIQGDFGKDTVTNLSRLDKIPQDPLVNQLYTYSITLNKQEYELAGITENTDIGYINNTFAGDQIAAAMVVGNYNGQTLKSNSGIICEILSLPTIISGDLETVNDLSQIIENEKLVYDGFNNLPTKFLNTRFKTDGGFNFKTNQLVVYSDSDECKNLYIPQNIQTRISFVKNLQKAYSGSILSGEGKIKTILDINPNDNIQLASMGVNIMNNNLGGDLSNEITDVPLCENYSYIPLTCPSGYIYNSSNKQCEEFSTQSLIAPSVCKAHTQMGQMWNPDLIVDAQVSPGNYYHGTYISGVVFNPFHYTTSDFRIRFDSNCVIYQYQKQTAISITNIPPGSTQTYGDTLENRSEPGCPTGYTNNGTQCISNSPINSSEPTCSNGVFEPTTNNCKINNCY